MIATAAVLVCAGYFLWQHLELRRENQELLRNQAQLNQRYAEANEKLVESQRFLERIRTDPAFVEMIIRRRLGYAKPGELIYNFETPSDNSPLIPLITSETAAPITPPPPR